MPSFVYNINKHEQHTTANIFEFICPKYNKGTKS